MKNFKRLWISGLVGMGFGFLVEVVAGIWIEGSVNGFLMIALIIGGAVGGWYILANNNDFKK